MRCIDGHMRGFAVQRIPGGVEITQTLPRICNLQQWPLGVAAEASRQVIGQRSQVDDGRRATQDVAVLRAQNRTSTGGHYRSSPTIQQIGQDLLLAIAESCFTFAVEKLPDRAADSLLDLVIDIHK